MALQQPTGLVPRQKSPVLLLKTRSAPNDSYEEYFSSSPFAPTFIPVLEHKNNVPNLGEVRSMICNGDLVGTTKRYGGLIFTSQRAVEAFAKVIEELEQSTSSLSLSSTASPDLFPLYTVGPATSRTLNTLLSKSIILKSYSSAIYGADTGNGENLAQYILSHYNSLNARSTKKAPLLFLVGEQRRDIIPKTLTSPDLPATERIGVDELVVYETRVMESFPEDFEKNIAISRRQDLPVISVVVFSPSGCEAMLLSLGYIDPTGKLTKEGQKQNRWPVRSPDDVEPIHQLVSNKRPRYCIASIGPTTRDYLYKTWGFEVDVCAEKPSPEGVGNGISRFLDTQGLDFR